MCEWRCSTGDGPIDSYRVKFTVVGALDKIFENVVSVKHKAKNTIQQHLVGESTDDYDQCYMAVRMPFVISPRDFVLERIHDRKRSDGSMMTVNRSTESDMIK